MNIIEKLSSLRKIDSEIYVLGHKSPDSDSITSALAMADLLSQLGIKAIPSVCGRPDPASEFIFDYLGIEMPQVISSAENKKVFLVDHSDTRQMMEGIKETEIVGIADHHIQGNAVSKSIPFIFFKQYGATATLVFECYSECGLVISQQIAKVMLIGILSDTRNLTVNTLPEDRTAFEELKNISGFADTDDIFKKMMYAASSYIYMSDEEIFFSDYKEYEIGLYSFGIGNITATDSVSALDMSERMRDVMKNVYKSRKLDWLFAKVFFPGNTFESTMTIISAFGEGASDILFRCFGVEEDNGSFIYHSSVSRKRKLLPMMQKVISEES